MNDKNFFFLINLLKYPVISEKTMKLIELNQYTFFVDRKITKTQIKKAIEFLFQVKAQKIRVLTCPKKKKKKRTKNGINVGQKSRYKKAIVHLKKEDKIDFFNDEIFQKQI